MQVEWLRWIGLQVDSVSIGRCMRPWFGRRIGPVPMLGRSCATSQSLGMALLPTPTNHP